jgi:uncharacterized protein
LAIFIAVNKTYASASETSADSVKVYETTSSQNTQTNQHIFDEAGLLSTSELNDLEEMCTQYGKEAGINIIILTHNNSKAKNAVNYIEDFYDKMELGDAVILLVDMHNRDVVIEGYGTAETYINSKRGDAIISDISPYLTDGEYVQAFKDYITSSAAYMKDDSLLNYDHDYSYDSNGNYTGSGYTTTEDSVGNVLSNVFFQLIASLIIGGIVVGIMVYQSGGKMTVGSNTYMDGNHSGLIGRRDDYVRTVVTRVRKPQDNNRSGGFNAGGFSGGISGGGHSHSTSSGKF